jgi:hypothetical protein
LNSRKIFLLTLFISVFGLLPGEQAQAYSEALIALQFSEGGLYRRAARIEKVLKEGYRFNRVRIVLNADEDALAASVRKFAAQPAISGERRFIWISGVDSRRADVPCPEYAFGPVEPRTALMMIAPACFRTLIALPTGIRHSEFAPSWIDPGRTPKPVKLAMSAGVFVFIGSPEDHPNSIEAADRAIMRRLLEGSGGPLSAYVLYETLRARLATGDSDFTPFLEVSHPKAAWATNLFGGNLAGPPAPAISAPPPNTMAPDRRIISRRFRLYRTPDISTTALSIFEAGKSVTVKRNDVSGTMAYVETEDGYYGWIDRTLHGFKRMPVAD